METQPTLGEVRHFLSTTQLPTGPFELDRGTRIVDVRKFVDLEFGVIDAGSSQAVLRPARDRLYQLYYLLTKPA